MMRGYKLQPLTPQLSACQWTMALHAAGCVRAPEGEAGVTLDAQKDGDVFVVLEPGRRGIS